MGAFFKVSALLYLIVGPSKSKQKSLLMALKHILDAWNEPNSSMLSRVRLSSF